PDTEKDAFIAAAIAFMLYRIPPGDPYDDDKCAVHADYNDISQACRLLERCHSDASLFSNIKNIIRAASKKLTQPQLVEIAAHLTRIVEAQLPKMRFINHEGYAILCLAEIVAARRGAKLNDWRPLLERIKQIPNA